MRTAWVTMLLIVALLAVGALAPTPLPASTAELRQGDAVVVGADVTVDDDLYAFGQSVTIYGTVTGDVMAAGQSVTIVGPIQGDLMAAGASVVVNGPVAGAARLAGQTVDVNAPIGHDLLGAAATLQIGPRAPIGRDVLAGGSAVTLGAPVGRSVRAGAESLTIGGPVGGDVLAQVGALRLAPGAAIRGSLSYASAQEAVVEAGATVGGMTTRMQAEPMAPEPSPAAQAGERVLGWFRMLVGLSVLGVLLVVLFPGSSRRAADTLTHAPWPSLGLGFAVLVAGPVAALMLFVLGLLIGGWWLGLLVLALYFGLLPVGFAVVGLLVGRYIMTRAGRPDMALACSLLAGLVFLGLVSLVPVAGGIVVVVALLFGLGASVLAVWAAYHERAPVAEAPPVAPEHPDTPIPVA